MAWALNKDEPPRFVEVDERIDANATSYEEALDKAGYVIQISSCADPIDGDAYRLTIRQNHGTVDYRYHLDLTGIDGQIAAVLARDFPELLEVLRRLKPLTQLMIDENVDSVARDQLLRNLDEKIEKERKRPKSR